MLRLHADAGSRSRPHERQGWRRRERARALRRHELEIHRWLRFKRRREKEQNCGRRDGSKRLMKAAWAAVKGLRWDGDVDVNITREEMKGEQAGRDDLI